MDNVLHASNVRSVNKILIFYGRISQGRISKIYAIAHITWNEVYVRSMHIHSHERACLMLRCVTVPTVLFSCRFQPACALCLATRIARGCCGLPQFSRTRPATNFTCENDSSRPRVREIIIFDLYTNIKYTLQISACFVININCFHGYSVLRKCM